jgi:hypothetical protein
MQVDSGVGATGVYIVEGRKGVLYYPRFDWSAHVYDDVSYNQFVEAV